jgi:hypothetical protein
LGFIGLGFIGALTGLSPVKVNTLQPLISSSKSFGDGGAPPYTPYMTVDMPLPDIASLIISALTAFMTEHKLRRRGLRYEQNTMSCNRSFSIKRTSNPYTLYSSRPDMRMDGVSAPIAKYSLKDMIDAQHMEYF